jgi:hypothetical protein
MWRFLAGVMSALLLVGAGLFFWKGIAQSDDPIPPPPLLPSQYAQPAPLAAPPSAERSREEKRYDRYDKDRDETITRDEYLAPRQKAFAKLDANGDGRLSFEEWVVKTSDKFAKADADRSKTLSREEFKTTRAKRATQPSCNCGDDGN